MQVKAGNRMTKWYQMFFILYVFGNKNILSNYHTHELVTSSHLTVKNLRVLEVWSKICKAEYSCHRCYSDWRKKGILNPKKRFVCAVSFALLIKGICETDLINLVY